MAGDYYLGAYWWNRKESADQCADRLLTFFEHLAPCDDLLARWYEKGWSRKEALKKRLDITRRELLLKLFRRKRDHEEGLGFTIGLWNGADDNHAISLSITCGGFAERLCNVVVINLPRDMTSLATVDRMSCVVRAVARAWEPEWAEVVSQTARELREFEMSKPFVDWMVYLSRDLLRDGTVIDWPGRVTTLGGRLGAIISTQDEPPDPNNPEHVRNIEQVRLALGL